MTITLVAEEGATLSSGSLHLYATQPPSDSATQPLIFGCIDLYNYDPLNRRCAVGIMVASEYRRKGYALAMLHALDALLSHPSTPSLPATQPLIHTLYADIAAVNEASLALFEKAGYSRCGHFKEWLEYDSHFIDNIRMQKILPNAKNLNQYQAG